MTPRFYFPSALPEAGEVPLPEDLAHHAARVLRLRAGDNVSLFDGRGGEVAARLQSRGKAWSVVLGERSTAERESPLRLVLVQALASGEKMDWIVQKAVELGVAGIVPVQTERSVLRLSGERAAKRVAHWRQVVVSACEQSGRNRVPEVDPIADLRDYLAAERGLQRLVLAPKETTRLASVARPVGTVHLLVGPEGGWSEAELAAFRVAGCIAVGLGPRVLRTETAGVAALAAAQVLWGDF